MSNGGRSALSVVVVLLLVASFIIGHEIHPPRAVSMSTFTPLHASDAGFYLAIGGSSSLGIQPDGVPSDDAEQTKNGYANDVVKLERRSTASGTGTRPDRLSRDTRQVPHGRSHIQLVLQTAHDAAHHCGRVP